MFLPQRVANFKMNRGLMLMEDPFEFLTCSWNIRNDDAATFSHLLLSVSSGSFTGLDKGPVWVATCLRSSPDVLLFLLLPLCLCGSGLSPMV